MTDAFKHFEQIFRLLQANSNVRFKTVDQKQNENTHTHTQMLKMCACIKQQNIFLTKTLITIEIIKHIFY